MRIAGCFLSLMAIILVAGCSAEKYGDAIDGNIPVVTVKDVILMPSFQGHMVKLEGIIITQCASNDGCWFFLHDGTGQIFVDLAPKGFTIPPRTGKKATMTGVVHQWKDGFRIVAHGVEIR